MIVGSAWSPLGSDAPARAHVVAPFEAEDEWPCARRLEALAASISVRVGGRGVADCRRNEPETGFTVDGSRPG
jgi:hypothetical protein